MRNVILLVDDNAEIRSAFSDLFRKTEMKVVTFANVNEAQVYLNRMDHRSSIKAIVSDLMMGPVDGLDFLSLIKKDPELAQIDFYLFTGAEISIFQPFIKSFSLKGIITKPFNAKVLLTLLAPNRNTVSEQTLKVMTSSQKAA